jgi:hypothetical protein
MAVVAVTAVAAPESVLWTSAVGTSAVDLGTLDRKTTSCSCPTAHRLVEEKERDFSFTSADDADGEDIGDSKGAVGVLSRTMNSMAADTMDKRPLRQGGKSISIIWKGIRSNAFHPPVHHFRRLSAAPPLPQRLANGNIEHENYSSASAHPEEASVDTAKEQTKAQTCSCSFVRHVAMLQCGLRS